MVKKWLSFFLCALMLAGILPLSACTKKEDDKKAGSAAAKTVDATQAEDTKAPEKETEKKTQKETEKETQKETEKETQKETEKKTEKTIEASKETKKTTETAKQSEAAKEDEKKSDAASEEAGPYKDGEYEATAVGYSGGLKVRVTIENGKIAKVEVVKHNEVGKQYYEAAIRDVPGLIIKKQGTEGIDAVSGSTMTTKGILKAVEKALKKAKK